MDWHKWHFDDGDGLELLSEAELLTALRMARSELFDFHPLGYYPETTRGHFEVSAELPEDIRGIVCTPEEPVDFEADDPDLQAIERNLMRSRRKIYDPVDPWPTSGDEFARYSHIPYQEKCRALLANIQRLIMTVEPWCNYDLDRAVRLLLAAGRSASEIVEWLNGNGVRLVMKYSGGIDGIYVVGPNGKQFRSADMPGAFDDVESIFQEYLSDKIAGGILPDFDTSGSVDWYDALYEACLREQWGVGQLGKAYMELWKTFRRAVVKIDSSMASLRASHLELGVSGTVTYTKDMDEAQRARARAAAENAAIGRLRAMADDGEGALAGVAYSMPELMPVHDRSSILSGNCRGLRRRLLEKRFRDEGLLPYGAWPDYSQASARARQDLQGYGLSSLSSKTPFGIYATASIGTRWPQMPYPMARPAAPSNSPLVDSFQFFLQADGCYGEGSGMKLNPEWSRLLPKISAFVGFGNAAGSDERKWHVLSSDEDGLVSPYRSIGLPGLTVEADERGRVVSSSSPKSYAMFGIFAIVDISDDTPDNP